MLDQSVAKNVKVVNCNTIQVKLSEIYSGDFLLERKELLVWGMHNLGHNFRSESNPLRSHEEWVSQDYAS